MRLYRSGDFTPDDLDSAETLSNTLPKDSELRGLLEFVIEHVREGRDIVTYVPEEDQVASEPIGVPEDVEDVEVVEGEVVEPVIPPEPPHDHVIETFSGDFYVWDERHEGWRGIDSNFGCMSTWESLIRWGGVTVYAPVVKIG